MGTLVTGWSTLWEPPVHTISLQLLPRLYVNGSTVRQVFRTWKAARHTQRNDRILQPQFVINKYN